MKVLHLLASPTFSGPAENVALLALAQRALGHEVSVAIDRKRTQAPAAEELAAPRFEALGLLDGGGLELSVKSTPWAVLKDVRALRARPVDVVHTHFTHDHLIARASLRRSVTLVRSVHAPRSLRHLPHAHGYTVASRDALNILHGRPAQLLPPLVDPRFRPAGDLSALRSVLGLAGKPLIGMVSTFQASRRHLLGLEAFERVRRVLPSARLVLVGDGALEPAVRARGNALGLSDALTFAGYQSGEAFVRWVQALDLMWVLGLGNDWSGRAAAQARACGVGVIGVKEGALDEWADVTLAEPSVPALVEATVNLKRRAVTMPSARDAASAVLDLYGRLRVSDTAPHRRRG